MTPLSSAPLPPHEPDVSLGSLVRPFVRRRGVVALCLLAAWGAGLAVVLLPRREYEARVVLAAVPSAKAASLAGGLSSLLGNAQLGGVQSTPYFITRLLLLRGVLERVADSPARGVGTAPARVIERVAERPAAEIEPGDVERSMRRMLSAEVDKQTGLVTFAATHPDSALARQVAEQVVAAARQTFVQVVRSQATAQRESGEAHVDSAARRLRRLEQQLQDFQSSHRVYATYSAAAVTRQRLDRELANAQAIYVQAMNDREGAVARELDATPALVVVDPVPARLVLVPRQGAIKLVLATVLGVVLAACVLAAQGEFAAAPPRPVTAPHPGLLAAARTEAA